MRLAARDLLLLLALLARQRHIARPELAHEELERRRVERQRLAAQQRPRRGVLRSGRLGRRQMGAEALAIGGAEHAAPRLEVEHLPESARLWVGGVGRVQQVCARVRTSASSSGVTPCSVSAKAGETSSTGSGSSGVGSSSVSSSIIMLIDAAIRARRWCERRWPRVEVCLVMFHPETGVRKAKPIPCRVPSLRANQELRTRVKALRRGTSSARPPITRCQVAAC